MRVYELMNELSVMSAGATVRVHAIKNDNEMELLDDNDDIKTYVINFEVQELTEANNAVEIDIW